MQLRDGNMNLFFSDPYGVTEFSKMTLTFIVYVLEMLC